MTLRKKEGTGILKRKNYFAFFGELALEEAMDILQEGQRNKCIPNNPITCSDLSFCSVASPYKYLFSSTSKIP
jgi:hypothetical protein